MLLEDIRKNINNLVGGMIGSVAKRLAGHAILHNQDYHDIYQTLLTHVLQRLPAFDPERGSLTQFVYTAVNRFGNNLIRDLQAGNRAPLSIQSLDGTVLGEGVCGPPLACKISLEQLQPLNSTSKTEDRIDLRIDMEEALENLPLELRDFAIRLKTNTISEIARQDGVPRTTCYGKIRQLRSYFEEYGLRKYLE